MWGVFTLKTATAVQFMHIAKPINCFTPDELQIFLAKALSNNLQAKKLNSKEWRININA